MTGVRVALEERLREAIRSGQLPEGSRLPSSRTYATEMGLSRGTVTAAFDQLVAEGYLVAHRGAGTRVAHIGTAADSAPRPTAAAACDISLMPGSPDVSTFPVNAWLHASRKALNAAPASTFGYGDPRGRVELRSALADYLGRARGVVTTADNIVVTTSYAQALALITAVLVARGRPRIGMEDPGLPYHRDIVRRCGGTVVPVAVDAQGVVPDLPPALGAVVVTAAHQYPTGAALAPQRRLALAAWAQRTGGLVVEDDYDGEFRYDRQPIGAMQGTAPDRVAYVGTVAKSLGPAVRIGWVVLPRHLGAEVTEAKRLTDHHTDTLAQLTFAELLTSHAFDRHVRAARLRYRRRRDLLVCSLRELDSLRLGGVAAGLQTLLLLPAAGPAEQDVIDLAAARGLALSGLDEHWHAPADQDQGLLIGFAAPTESAYPAALSALGRVLAETLG